jgi:isopentenyldiphosphate isomerase
VDHTDDQAELFRVVDAAGRPLGLATRAACHADSSLIHRSVAVVVTTPAGRLFQRRGLGKDTGAGAWDVACSGHVGAGETDEEAARRELAEEVGITDATPVHLGTLLLELATETELCAVFAVASDGPFVVRPPEVIGLACFGTGERPTPLTPSARRVLAFADTNAG